MPTEYDAFISYSHAADGKLAPTVQRGLSRLAKKWNQRQALRVFRDDTGLAVSPHLWGSIAQALDHARFFVLFASPDAAASEWVNKEVEHWREVHGVDTILPVVTDGTWKWDHATEDFTPGSTAVPVALRRAFTEEPRHLDLRWARDESHLSLHNTRFRSAIAELAAPMHGVSKEELESEDLHQQRKTLRLARSAVVLLALLTIGAVVGAGFAVANAHRAEQQRRAAVARELAFMSGNLAGENLPAALVLAAAAEKTDAGSGARGALLRATLAGPQLERSIRRSAGAVVIPAGDGSAFVVVDHSEHDQVTVYAPSGRRRQVVAAPGVGRVSEVHWVQTAGPATRPTGLLISGSEAIALAGFHGDSPKLSDARMLSKVWSSVTSPCPACVPALRRRVSVSNDGTRVAVQPRRGELRLFTLDPDARMLYRNTFAASDDPDQHSARYSENGNFVVLASPKRLTVRDARTGELVSEQPSGRLSTLSDDGTLIVASEKGLFSVPPGTTMSGNPRFIALPGITLDDPGDPDPDLVTRRGGNEVALATVDEVMVADVLTGRVLWRSPEPEATAQWANPAPSVFFVPGSSLLLDVSRAGVALRDVATGAVVWESPGASEKQLSPNGRFDVLTNAGANHDATVIVDLVGAKVVAQQPLITGNAFWSQDETALITFSNQPRLWKFTSADVTSSRAGLQGAPMFDEHGVGRAAFMPGGKRLLTVASGRVTVWGLGSSNAMVGSQRTYGSAFEDRDPASGVLAITDRDDPHTVVFSGPHGEHLGRYDAPGDPSVRVLAEGRRALVQATAADGSTSVAVVDVRTGRAISKGGKICGFDNSAPLVASHSARWFLGTMDQGAGSLLILPSLVACNPPSGSTRPVLGNRRPYGPDQPDISTDIAISDDGRWAVYTTQAREIRFMDLLHPERAAPSARHQGQSSSQHVVISTNGVRAWVLDGNTLWPLDRKGPAQDPIAVPLDETASSSILAVDPGQHLAAVELVVGDSIDEAGRTEVVTVLLDLDEGSVLGTINDENVNPTATFGFSEHGSELTRVVEGEDSYTVQTWDIGVRRLVRLACERSGGNLTPREWKAVAPNTDYVAPCANDPN